MDWYTSASRGTAFVTFKAAAGVEAALKLHDTELGGQKVRVNLASKGAEKGGEKGAGKGSGKASEKGSGKASGESSGWGSSGWGSSSWQSSGSAYSWSAGGKGQGKAKGAAGKGGKGKGGSAGPAMLALGGAMAVPESCPGVIVKGLAITSSTSTSSCYSLHNYVLYDIILHYINYMT